MNDIIDFETFLYIGSKDLRIVSNAKNSSKFFYDQKKDIAVGENKFNLEILDNFLENNVIKIEKILGNFLNNIFIVIDLDIFFSVKLSIKKKNYGKTISLKDLKHLLNESKEECKSTLQNKRIIHMIIDKYQIDNNHYYDLPESLNCEYFSIDVRFITLSENLVKNFEDILKKYHISLSKIICAEYMKEMSSIDEINFVDMTKKVINGFNRNEILLAEKTSKNKGFFEKFFHFFS